MKKLVSIVFIIILFMPISFAKDVEIRELFSIDEKSLSDGSTSYFYVNSKLIVSSGDDLTYYYQDRLGSDFGSKSLPFGQPILEEARFSFTGKELDDDLYNFGARYYNPDLGRFISVDPVEENHPYTYVENNPLNMIDPDGRDGNKVPFDQNFNIGYISGEGKNYERRANYEKSIDEVLSKLGLEGYELQHVEIQIWDPNGDSLGGDKFYKIINSEKTSGKKILGLSNEFFYGGKLRGSYNKVKVGYAILRSVGLNPAASAQHLMDVYGKWKTKKILGVQWYYGSGAFNLPKDVMEEVNEKYYSHKLRVEDKSSKEIHDIEFSEDYVADKWINDVGKQEKSYWEYLHYLGGGDDGSLKETLFRDFSFLGK